MTIELIALVLICALQVAVLLQMHRLWGRHRELMEEVRRRHAEMERLLQGFQPFLDRKLETLKDDLRAKTQESERNFDLLKAIKELTGQPAQGAADAVSTSDSGSAAYAEPSRPSRVEAGVRDVSEKAERHAPEPSSEPEKPAAIQFQPGSTLEIPRGDVRELPDILGVPEFLGDLWHRMNGDFEASSRVLVDFFSRQGLPPPGVSAHPPLAPQARKHWTFLVVERTRGNGQQERALIPRYYSRYDPAIYDHLFDVRGRNFAMENFLRECHAVAILEPTGALESLIDRDLVLKKGVLVV